MLKQKRIAAPQDAVRSYLHDTLGVRPAIRPWADAGKLPYFLQDAFDLYELKVRDHSLLLAVNRRKKTPPLGTVRDRLSKLQAAADCPVVYATDALASYERKRLIEQKVPFIVPGNQLYLPDLGIDLREYFRQETHAPAGALSPATQAMLIRALLEKSTQTAWHPAAIAEDLGYTAMTLSRVVKELIGTGIATLDRRGTARWLRMDRPAAQTWDQAKSLLRSPVKRQVWMPTAAVLAKKKIPLAGLSALARYSSLAEPSLPVYAMSAVQLKALSEKGLETTPEPVPGGCQLQVWTYAPILGADAKIADDTRVVDPLSLKLSFQDISDERIELALEELREHFPW